MIRQKTEMELAQKMGDSRGVRILQRARQFRVIALANEDVLAELCRLQEGVGANKNHTQELAKAVQITKNSIKKVQMSNN